MTIPETKQWLNRGWELNETINKKLEQQYKAFNSACNTTSSISNEKIHTSHTNSTEDIFAAYIDLSREVDELIDKLCLIKMEILDILKLITNRFYRKILYWHCFQFKDWEWIAEQTNISKASIKKYHYIKAIEDAGKFIG